MGFGRPIALANGNTFRAWAENGRNGVAKTANYQGKVRKYLHDGLYERVIGLSELVRNARRMGDPMHLEFGYIDDIRFRARSTHVGGIDIIAINVGVTVRLATVLHAMLSHPDLLPGLYYLGCEGGSVILDEARYPDGPIDPAVELVLPGMAASELDILVVMAENFILRHELAHISHGHLDWYRARTGLYAVGDEQAGMDQLVAPIDRQTLEWDADSDAISVTLQSAIGAKVAMKDGRRIWEFPAYGPNGPFMQQLQRACTAMYVAMRFTAEELPDVPVDQLLANRYPPTSIRMGSVAALISYILRLRGGLDEDWIADHVLQFMMLAETAWARVFQTEEKSICSPQSYKVGAELTDHFTERWRVLRPQLLPFARWGVLAPAEPEQLM